MTKLISLQTQMTATRTVTVAMTVIFDTIAQMKSLLNLVFVGLIVYGFFWYLGVARQDEGVRQAEAEFVTEVGKAADALQEKLRDHSLDAGTIKTELEGTGKVVRQLARKVGTVMAESGAATRITATITAKLIADPELSPLSISVNTTDGLVTLSGAAPSHDLIGKAMLFALETEGVHEVISTLQVRKSKEH
jgi:hyperosmotically inducible protein